MNATRNGSGCLSPGTSITEKIGKTFVYCTILVVSLVGNSFIALILYKTNSLRTPINYFIANMAASDLLYPIFLIPSIIQEMYLGSWVISGPFGQTLCKLDSFLADVSTAVSVQSLVLIAADRFGAVVLPLRSPLISSKLCPFFILATWIVAIAIFSPYFFAKKLVEYPDKLSCELRWKEAFGESSFQANYFLSLYIVLFYIPIVLLVIIYSIILIKLKFQKIPGEQSVNSSRCEKQRAQRNRNVLQMAIAIVLGFLLCWVPWSVINVIIDFAWDSKLPCGILIYYSISQFMAQANCAINPCVCLIFSKNFRQGLKRLLKCFGEMQD